MNDEKAPIQSMLLWKITSGDWITYYIAAETIPIALDVLLAKKPNIKVESVLSVGTVDMWYSHRQHITSVA